MRCPRCEVENDALARSCAACALPLAIAEGEPATLDRAIQIDRRRGERAPLPENGPAPRHLERERDVEPELEPERERGLDRDPAPDLDLDRDLDLDPDPDPDPDPDLDLDPDPPLRARRALAWVIDAALLAAFAALPLVLASGGHPFAALRQAPLPAAGLLAILAVGYAALCHALAGATLGKLALFTKSGRASRVRALGGAVVRA